MRFIGLLLFRKRVQKIVNFTLFECQTSAVCWYISNCFCFCFVLFCLVQYKAYMQRFVSEVLLLQGMEFQGEKEKDGLWKEREKTWNVTWKLAVPFSTTKVACCMACSDQLTLDHFSSGRSLRIYSLLQNIRTLSGARTTSCTTDAVVFLLGVKQAKRETDHSPPSSAEVTERVDLYSVSPSLTSWTVIQRNWPFCCFVTSVHSAYCGKFQNSNAFPYVETQSILLQHNTDILF